MIGGLLGRAAHHQTSNSIMRLDVNGVIYEFRVPLRDRNFVDSRPIESFFLFYTHTHQREEYDEWFGFIHELDRECFKRLIKLTKVGPSLAMKLLDTFNHSVIEDLRVDELLKIPGIGQTTAQTIHEAFHAKSSSKKGRK
jgi:Holliday junction DNA helicase RuvA